MRSARKYLGLLFALLLFGEKDALFAGVPDNDITIRQSTKAKQETLGNGSEWQGIALKTNILYAATASANLGLDLALNDHFSAGVLVGVKPWPRWWAGDWDAENPTKWRHILVTPDIRWWPFQVFKGWFVGVDFAWAHVNMANLNFPLSAYSELKDHRLQGDLFTGGMFMGYSWSLGTRVRVEIEGGVRSGVYEADKFVCVHCGEKLGHVSGPTVIPNAAVNLIINLTQPNTAAKAQKNNVLNCIDNISQK